MLYNDLELIDLHFHIMEPHSIVPPGQFLLPTKENALSLLEIMKECGFDKVNIPAISLYDPEDLACNPLALYTKSLCPDRIYAFAGLRRSLIKDKNTGIVKQAQQLIAAGFDGFKLICKPNVRRKFNIPICDPIFDDFYGYAEKNEIPILFHVGDPESFWNPDLVPHWAKENGWYYGGDHDIPTMKGLYNETIRMLERFPKLNVVFAHFFFQSSYLEEAATIFDKFENVRFDLTPGSEMYIEFNNNPEESREFFIKYSDRLIFGTDNTGVNGHAFKDNLEQSRLKVVALRTFFETEENFSAWGEDIKGLGLPKEVCKKIYADNFNKLLKYKAPNKLNPVVVNDIRREYVEVLSKEKDKDVELIELLNSLDIK